MGNLLYYLVGVSLIGMAYSYWKYYQLSKLEAGSTNSTQIAKTIKNGALSFIQTEYRIMVIFALAIGILLFFKGQNENQSNWQLAFSYVFGVGISGAAAYLGVLISSQTNVLTSNESRISFAKGFKSATDGSAAIGLSNASLLTFGLVALLILFSFTGKSWDSTTTLNVLAGFAMGASTVSLFLRYGGGIFAKSAEIADNQIQNSEPGILANSLHNPTSSANDVGHILSDIAGIGADIFDSFSSALIATMVIGIGFLSSEAIIDHLAFGPILVPLAISSAGLLTSAGAIFILKAIDKNDSKKMLLITEGLGAAGLALVSFFATKFLLPAEWDVVKESDKQVFTTTYYSLGMFWCSIFGIAASVGIGQISYLFFNSKLKSVQNAAAQSSNGTDSGILSGLQNGFLSIGLPVALVIAVSVLSYFYSGFYGLGIASVSMLANLGFYNTICTFAPISDTANTIGIKSAMSEDALVNTKDLKLIGLKSLVNSRNYMIVGATIAAITMLSAFIEHSGIELVNMSKPLVITGILLGAVLPFILSSSVLTSIMKTSRIMCNEAKRQFSEIKVLAEAKEILDKYRGVLTYATEGEKEIVYGAVDDVNHKQLVEVSTYPLVWETMIVGGVAIALTALLGYFAGIEILAGFLMGLVSGGVLLSLFMANSGNTYESTKIAFEEGITIGGEVQSTNSAGYQPSVITDKSGKPMKDAISPTIMVILKMILITSIIISSALIHREMSKKGLHIQNIEKQHIPTTKDVRTSNQNNYLI